MTEKFEILRVISDGSLRGVVVIDLFFKNWVENIILYVGLAIKFLGM